MATPIFNEMSDAAGLPRPHYQAFDAWLKGVNSETVHLKQTEADLIFRRTPDPLRLDSPHHRRQRMGPP